MGVRDLAQVGVLESNTGVQVKGLVGARDLRERGRGGREHEQSSRNDRHRLSRSGWEIPTERAHRHREAAGAGRVSVFFQRAVRPVLERAHARAPREEERGRWRDAGRQD